MFSWNLDPYVLNVITSSIQRKDFLQKDSFKIRHELSIDLTSKSFKIFEISFIYFLSFRTHSCIFIIKLQIFIHLRDFILIT